MFSSDLQDMLYEEFDTIQDMIDSFDDFDPPTFEPDCCEKCGRSYSDPVKNGCNPLLSCALDPTKNVHKVKAVVCNKCDLRDMYGPYINKFSKDWEKGTFVVNTAEVLAIRQDLNLFDSVKDNLETDRIWNQVMIKKEKRSDYGSDSNFSELNDLSDEFSEFLYGDEPGGSIFSDIMKSEDSLDDEDKMIDVESIDQNEILPGCSSHSAQVAQMHNYSTPLIDRHRHHDSFHTPLGIRNMSKIQKKPRIVDCLEEEDEENEEEVGEEWTPNSSDAEETFHMLSSTRVVKRRAVHGESSPVLQQGRRGRKPLSAASSNRPNSSRKRQLSEERDYLPEQKRRKEFDDEKREQHNVLERIRRCEMSNLILDIQELLPSLRPDKKHSKVVVLDTAASYARNETREVEMLLSKEKQLDACIAKLRRLCDQES